LASMAEDKAAKPDWDTPPGGVDAATLAAGPLPADTFEPQTPSGSEAQRPHGGCQPCRKSFQHCLVHTVRTQIWKQAATSCSQCSCASMRRKAASLFMQSLLLQAAAAWILHLMPAADRMQAPHTTCKDQVDAASCPRSPHVVVATSKVAHVLKRCFVSCCRRICCHSS
jgi:hypothetical protein